MDKEQSTEIFIQEWLNHFSIPFESNIKVSSSSTLDFLIKQWSLGVLIVDWKRPISVQVVNKAFTITRKLELDQIYLIAREISDPATKTLQRYDDKVMPLHPNGLSELAIKFSQLMQKTSITDFAHS